MPELVLPTTTVRDLMTSCPLDNTISADEDVMKALERMNQSKLSRMLVTEGNHIAGVITLKYLLEFLSVKLELEEKPA